MKNMSKKLRPVLLIDIISSLTKARKPDEYELRKIANAWMIVGYTVFLLFVPGKMVTDTLSVRGLLNCSIGTYNSFISLILQLAFLIGSYYLLSQGISHWQGAVLLVGGLTFPLSLSIILMDSFSSPIPYNFILPLTVVLLVSMEIVYRKGCNY